MERFTSQITGWRDGWSVVVLKGRLPPDAGRTPYNSGENNGGKKDGKNGKWRAIFELRRWYNSRCGRSLLGSLYAAKPTHHHPRSLSLCQQ
jgi:hypothetical protein